MNQTIRKIEKNKMRVIADPQELEWLRRCVSYATANPADLEELWPESYEQVAKPVLARLTERIELLQGPAKQKLKWVADPESGETVYAFIGEYGDHVMFSLTHYPTCHRRGQWRLIVDVCDWSPHHYDWGCFDSDDQPLRNFHSLFNAIEEAELIAAVLLKERLERGPLERCDKVINWVHTLWKLAKEQP